MARVFTFTNPDYIYRVAPVTGAPFSMSAWYYVTTAGSNRTIACLADTASDNNNYLMYYSGSDARPYFFIQSAAGTAQTATPTTRAISSWWHACAIEAADNDHKLYNHGELKISTTSRTPSSIDRLTIGIRADATPDFPFAGSVAAFALWDAALTEAEALSLQKGYSPLLIRPQNLVSCLPLIRDNDADLIDGVIWTASGSPGVGTHPYVLHPVSTS